VESTVALLGCGYTLSRVAKKLAPMSALCIKKDISSLEGLTQNISSLDVSNYVAFNQAINAHDSVCCIVDSIPPHPQEPTLYARNIAQFITENEQIDKLIYLSTTGVFGGENGAIVDELTTPNPTTPTGKARYEVECCYRELKKQLLKKDRTLQLCVLRIPAIYGPTRGIGLSLRQGKYKIIESGEQWTNRIHVVDLATLIVKLIESSKILPECIAVSDGAPSKVKDVVGYYCDKFKIALPSTISRQDAKAQGSWSMISDQRVVPRFMRDFLSPAEINYPSYLVGAGSEFSQVDR
jgi:hypothetical protein